MKKNEIIRTDKGAPREETKGILPHLFLAETIELLDQIIYFFKRMSAKVQSTLTELRMEHKQLLRSNTRQQKQMGMIERQIEELYRAEGFVFAESEEVKYQKSKKQLELEKQISLAEGALSELYFKRLPRLLPDFIRYFHGEKKGKKNVAKKKNWKGLQADFLKENYPNTYQTFKQDSDLTEFSLTSWEYDNEMTLIKFLQSFGQEHPIGIKPGFTDSFDLEKYPVLRTDYTQSVDRHGRTLDEVQGASFKIPSLKELMGIKYE